MSDDLLAKEKEFYRLNRELKLKMYEMMKEINSVVNTRVNDSSLVGMNQLCSNSATRDVKTTRIESGMSRVNKRSKESVTISETQSAENISDVEILFKKNGNPGNEAIVNLFKSKIDMLYKELEIMQLEYNRKCEYSKELEIKNKRHEETRNKLHNQIESLNDTVVKLENTNSDTLSKCQILSNKNTALKKDLSSLKKEVKVLSQQSTNYDARLNRFLENNEKLKNTLKYYQIEEKELRNQIRNLHEEKSLAIKYLKKQRSELVQLFKKQSLLVDNLKKQSAYLTTNGLIHLTEKDFANLMQWRPCQL